MPETFTSARVEGEEAIAEQVRPRPIGAVIVIGRRPGGEVGDAPLFVDGDLAPRVGSARVLPSILRPGLVTEFTGIRDCVESPDQSAANYVVGAEIAGRGKIGFACGRA